MDSDAEGVSSEFFDYFKVEFIAALLSSSFAALARTLGIYLELDLIFVLCIQVLCIQGFLTCRKHAERIILLVEMVQVKSSINFLHCCLFYCTFWM